MDGRFHRHLEECHKHYGEIVYLAKTERTLDICQGTLFESARTNCLSAVQVHGRPFTPQRSKERLGF